MFLSIRFFSVRLFSICLFPVCFFSISLLAICFFSMGLTAVEILLEFLWSEKTIITIKRYTTALGERYIMDYPWSNDRFNV